MYSSVSLPMNMNVNLLTHGFWPSYAPIALNLPPMFHQVQDIYTDFYMQKFMKRILTWQNSLGVCTVNANYPMVRVVVLHNDPSDLYTNSFGSGHQANYSNFITDNCIIIV
jgi:hypothetical protein